MTRLTFRYVHAPRKRALNYRLTYECHFHGRANPPIPFVFGHSGFSHLFLGHTTPIYAESSGAVLVKGVSGVEILRAGRALVVVAPEDAALGHPVILSIIAGQSGVARSVMALPDKAPARARGAWCNAAASGSWRSLKARVSFFLSFFHFFLSAVRTRC